MTTAAIYIRVSSADQEDNYSLGSQEAACREYAATLGAEITAVYRDVHTGTELWERPQLTALREAVRRGEITAVICYSVDRLSRDPTHLGVVVSEAQHHGVAAHFVTEPFDDSPEGELIRFVRGYAGKIEYARLKDRAMRGKLGRVQAGKLLISGKPLYGYTLSADRGRYLENPITAPVVRRIFQRAAEGATLSDLKADLEGTGVPASSGTPHWPRTTIRALLHNPAYAGHAVANRHRAYKAPGSKFRTMVERPEEEWIRLPEGTIPALVTAETFAAVQARLRVNKERLAGRPARDPEEAILRHGFVRCGFCGSTAYVSRGGRGVVQYRCNRGAKAPGMSCGQAILAAELDAAVWTRVMEVLDDERVIERRLAALRANDPTAADLAALEPRRAEAERRRKNLVERVALVDDIRLARDLLDQAAIYAADLDRLDTERAALLTRRAAWEASQAWLRDLQAGRARVRVRLERATYERKREALIYLDVRVTLYDRAAPERYVIELLPLPDDLTELDASA